LLRNNNHSKGRKNDVFLPAGRTAVRRVQSPPQKFCVNFPVKRDFDALGHKSSHEATWQHMGGML
jgi:hypothetical protein